MTLLAPLLALSLAVAPPPGGDTPFDLMPSAGLETQGGLQTDAITTKRFRIVHTPRAKGSAQVLARELEPMRDDVAALLGRDWPGVTEVRVGFGREEYEAMSLPGAPPPPWAIALAYPGRNIVLVEATSLTTLDGPLTLRHELVHVALGQFGKVWPHWFQEGLAMELTGERKWQLEQVATLTRAVTQDRVYEFDELSDRFPSSQENVDIAYAQSAAFVEFLRARHGSGAFQRLIDRVSQGDGFEKAFGAAFWVPLSMEEEAFKKDLPRRYPWWPLLLSGGTLVWAVMSVLLIVAWVRRRREVRELRARQLRVETLHEAARALLVGQPANDDDTSLEHLPYAGTPMPWVINIVQFTEPLPRSNAAAPSRASGSGSK